MSNKKLNLCMLSGSFEYDSEPSLEAFAAHLEANHRVVPATIGTRLPSEWNLRLDT